MGGRPALMRWALATTPDWAAWREHFGQPDSGDGVGGEEVPQHLPGADGRQLVDVADEQ
jgi:hypothetical protein